MKDMLRLILEAARQDMRCQQLVGLCCLAQLCTPVLQARIIIAWLMHLSVQRFVPLACCLPQCSPALFLGLVCIPWKCNMLLKNVSLLLPFWTAVIICTLLH